MQIIGAILAAIAALPKIGDMVIKLISWWKEWRQGIERAETQEKLHAAKEATKAATTKEERINAAKKWQEAMRRPRTPPAS